MINQRIAHYIFRLNQLVFIISLILTIDGLIPRKQIQTTIDKYYRPLEYTKHNGYIPSRTKLSIVMSHDEMLVGINEVRRVEVGDPVLLYKTRILGIPKKIVAQNDSYVLENVRVIHRYFFFLPWLVMLLSLYTVRMNRPDILLNIGTTNIVLLVFILFLMYK